MAKSKLSIADIAAESMYQVSRGNVVTDQIPHDKGGPDQSSRNVDIATKSNPTTSSNPTTGNVGTEMVSRDQVPVSVPPGFRVRTRIEKPHVSLYAHPKVLDTVREIARAEGRKAHDIYIDGLKLILAQRGFDFDRLNRGE